MSRRITLEKKRELSTSQLLIEKSKLANERKENISQDKSIKSRSASDPVINESNNTVDSKKVNDTNSKKKDKSQRKNIDYSSSTTDNSQDAGDKMLKSAEYIKKKEELQRSRL